jgi:hypothetical protein
MKRPFSFPTLEKTRWPWDGLKLSHARMRPRSYPGLRLATSYLFARVPGQVVYFDSVGFPSTNCMCIFHWEAEA